MALEEIGARLSLKDRRAFSADAAKARRDVKDVGDEAERTGRKADRASRGFVGMRSSMGALRTGAALAVTALGAVAGAGGLASFKMVTLASDAAETQSKFSTVFKGIEAPVNDFVKATQQKFGVPTKELQDAASTFGVFGKAAGIPIKDLAGFSTSLTQAGLDLSSFYNTSPGEALLALRSGLAGEAEPLRKFGIFLSDATLQARAKTMGLTGALTESQKVMIRQKIILGGLGDAQGDLARTAGGMANQWRTLKGRLQEGATVIGTALLPKALELLTWANDRFGPAMKKMPDFIDRATAVIGTFLDRVGAIFREDVMPVLRDLMTVFKRDVLPVLKTAAAVVGGGLVVAFKAASGVVGFFAENAGLLGPLLAGVLSGFVALKVITTVSKAFAAFNAVLALNPIGLVVIAIAALAGGLVYAYRNSETFRDVVDGVFKFVLKGIRFAVDKILGLFENIAKAAASAFGWVPGLGPKLQAAARDIEKFRDDVNASLTGIIDKDVTIAFKAKFAGPPVPLGAIDGRAIAGPLVPVQNTTAFGPKLPGLAHGGAITKGGFAITGERGPELSWWPRGSMVLPNSTSAPAQVEPLSALSSSLTAGNTIHIENLTINAPPGADGRQMADELVAELRRQVARA